MKKNDTDQTEPESLFELRSAYESSRSAEAVAVPALLFDEYWREGELAVLFGDSATGKSTLAVQIAESIARGNSLGKLVVNAPAQGVIYIDLKLTDRQFELRYSEAADSEEGEKLTNRYEFSPLLQRPAIKLGALKSGGLPHKLLASGIDEMVSRSTAKVVVIDRISNLRTSGRGTRETVMILRELDRLKRELGLSILVVANSTRRDMTRPMTLDDLELSGIYRTFADNIFAIAPGKYEELFYLRHLTDRGGPINYSSAHVPELILGTCGGNFRGFGFSRFADESEHRGRRDVDPEWGTIDEIKQLSDDGHSLREIAGRLGISKTKAHRLYHLWRPEPAKPDCKHVVPDQKKLNPYYFPGREEYDTAQADPRFRVLYEDETPENYALRREYYEISLGCVNARKVFLKTGTAPPLAEMLKEVRAKVYEPHNATETELPLAAVDTNIVKTGPMTGLKRAFNALGKEIFIEAEFDKGKPRVWYEFTSNGKKKRWVSDGWGRSGELIEDPNHRAQYRPREMALEK